MRIPLGLKKYFPNDFRNRYGEDIYLASFPVDWVWGEQVAGLHKRALSHENLFYA